MTSRARYARITLYLTAIICISIGLVYIFKPGLMPYHIEFLGKAESELDPRVLKLLVLAKKLIGGLALTIGGTLAIITWNIQSAPRWLILSLLWLVSVPFIATGYVVSNVRGLIPLLGIILLAAVAFTGVISAARDRA